jgi:hypothetical protein
VYSALLDATTAARAKNRRTAFMVVVLKLMKGDVL